MTYAALILGSQKRKGTSIPYISHLMSVSALVMEYGGDEDQAIAGLLHDSLEDCGPEHFKVIVQPLLVCSNEKAHFVGNRRAQCWDLFGTG